VYTTGLDPDVSSVSASTTSDGSKSTATNTNGATAAVSTAAGGETTVVTSSSRPQQPSADDMGAQQKSTHNTAAIAAGVVVGVVGVAALAGAVWFFYRSKKQKAQGFRGTSGGYDRDSQPPSMSDSRFDGGYMAQRRQSNGSIDDDHDFSRRILQVRLYLYYYPRQCTNPRVGDQPRPGPLLSDQAWPLNCMTLSFHPVLTPLLIHLGEHLDCSLFFDPFLQFSHFSSGYLAEL